jgi:hypothetical protein
VDTTTVVIIAVAAALVVVAIAVIWWAIARSRRTRRLKGEFGSEYDRALRTANGRRPAEATLRDREKRVESYELRTLEPAEARRFAERWRSLQAQFVDEPGMAVEQADNLLAEVMAARGYGSTTARERVEDVSVGHGDEAEEYRLARATAIRRRDGVATTEELRQAMLHYERVFDAMLGATPARN